MLYGPAAAVLGLWPKPATEPCTSLEAVNLPFHSVNGLEQYLQVRNVLAPEPDVW